MSRLDSWPPYGVIGPAIAVKEHRLNRIIGCMAQSLDDALERKQENRDESAVTLFYLNGGCSRDYLPSVFDEEEMDDGVFLTPQDKCRALVYYSTAAVWDSFGTKILSPPIVYTLAVDTEANFTPDGVSTYAEDEGVRSSTIFVVGHDLWTDQTMAATCAYGTVDGEIEIFEKNIHYGVTENFGIGDALNVLVSSRWN